MEVERVHDEEEAAHRAAEKLAAAINAGARQIALAGGATPRRAYQLLGPLVDDWSGVHLWFGDERSGDPDDPQSNYRMVRESLIAPGATLHRIPGELEPDAAAERYGQEFGDTVLDVAMLGLGEDGHTASLFPGRPALEATGVAVGVHDAPKPPPERVSLTLPTLNASRQILLLTTGAQKAEALARVLLGPSVTVPASMLARDRVEVIADEAALPQ